MFGHPADHNGVADAVAAQVLDPTARPSQRDPVKIINVLDKFRLGLMPEPHTNNPPAGGASAVSYEKRQATLTCYQT